MKFVLQEKSSVYASTSVPQSAPGGNEMMYALRVALTPFLVSRLVVFLILLLATQMAVVERTNQDGKAITLRHGSIQFQASSIGSKLRDVFMQADAAWYQGIATNGYTGKKFSTGKQENWAFFPLFPLLTKSVSWLTGNFFTAGLLVSNVCFLFALVLLFRLAQMYGYGDEVGQRALWFLSFFPTSYFLSAPITEALFLFLMLLAFFLLKKGQFISTGVVFALLTATRPTGLLLIPALLVSYAERGKRMTLRMFVALLLAPLGIIFYSYYLYRLTGNALAWLQIQTEWNRASFWTGALPERISFKPMLLMSDWNFSALHLALLALAFVSVCILFRRRAYALATLVAVPLLAAVLTGTLLSVSRFVLVLYPVHLILALYAGTPTRERIALVLLVALCALMTAMYALHITAAMA